MTSVDTSSHQQRLLGGPDKEPMELLFKYENWCPVPLVPSSANLIAVKWCEIHIALEELSVMWISRT